MIIETCVVNFSENTCIIFNALAYFKITISINISGKLMTVNEVK